MVVLEAALTVVVMGQMAGGVRRYPRQRAHGTGRKQALQGSLQAALPGPVAFWCVRSG